jgi:hypothetical protein
MIVIMYINEEFVFGWYTVINIRDIKCILLYVYDWHIVINIRDIQCIL